MTIKIKCPVCNAGNTLTSEELRCRRCKEDLSMLYQVKGYAFKYRLYLLQMLNQKSAQRQQIASSAQWLRKPKKIKVYEEK